MCSKPKRPYGAFAQFTQTESGVSTCRSNYLAAPSPPPLVSNSAALPFAFSEVGSQLGLGQTGCQIHLVFMMPLSRSNSIGAYLNDERAASHGYPSVSRGRMTTATATATATTTTATATMMTITGKKRQTAMEEMPPYVKVLWWLVFTSYSRKARLFTLTLVYPYCP